jgi:hypothetical protein
MFFFCFQAKADIIELGPMDVKTYRFLKISADLMEDSELAQGAYTSTISALFDGIMLLEYSEFRNRQLPILVFCLTDDLKKLSKNQLYRRLEIELEVATKKSPATANLSLAMIAHLMLNFPCK